MFEQNKDIIRKYREIHNTNHLDQLGQVVSEDIVSHNQFPGLPGGLEGARMAHRIFTASFPDTKTITDDFIAEGDRVVERWTNSGTHTGAPFMGVLPSKRKYSVKGISVYRIIDGKIVEHWSELNTLAILQALGDIRAPGQAGNEDV
jgi:predicted ester cyclase